MCCLCAGLIQTCNHFGNHLLCATHGGSLYGPQSTFVPAWPEVTYVPSIFWERGQGRHRKGDPEPGE